MKILRHWKILFAFLMVFVAGAVAGIVGTHVQMKRAFESDFQKGAWTAHALDFLQKKLNLTPEQRPKIQAILDDAGREFKPVFTKTIQQSGEIMARMGKRIDQELTPGQRIVHQKMDQEFRDGLKSKLGIDLNAP